ncbi:MAG: hypothetical protein HGA97_01025 [Chlorobiaceae bacterium]|nr:hypothetical protein [Chlorobiaceae bacterium]
MRLQNQPGAEKLRWLRAHPHPPFLEHLSFMLGNQLFFILIVDVDHSLETPGTIEGLLSIADGCAGHACIMPMRKTPEKWVPTVRGWGLLDAATRQRIHPPDLISDEFIIMTDWELHDFAIQVVREHIEKDGYQLMSWQNNPEINPSLWFVGPDGPEWVVVRAVRYPAKKAIKPDNLPEIWESCERYRRGSAGNFASVLFTSLEESFDPRAEENGNIAPLYRGKGADYQYAGLERLAFT